MNEISVSVALVTRNRPESLERTLRSLQPQRAHVKEVIVSDDSDPEHSGEVDRISHEYDCRYVRGPQRGLYANRNHAAGLCRGTHIRTMDDDHEFPEGHFEKCVEALRQDPDSIWIIGERYPGDTDLSVPPPCPGQLVARGFSVAPPNRENCWAISDGATIYPRAIFNRGVCYVETIKFGAGYLEFGSRLHWLGYRIRQLLTTYVLHHFDPAARSFMDVEVDMSSRFFAMLCHSWIYQPCIRNKALSAFEMIKEILRHGDLARRAIHQAVGQYRGHRASLEKQKYE
ncbi:MAG TPA: glycosyltransferase family 2 protein [Chthoniobacterales bacterium]|nr:glycosyltransferase family 2 protein [Chthoniobacterales bacterium]